jgi:REG-2-like HAD superfamily hydrolase
VIRAVCLDAGATLLHPDPPVEQVYARVFAEDGARFAPEALRDALARTWDDVQSGPPGDRYGGVSGERAFWRSFLARVRARVDGGEVSQEAFGRLAAHFQEPGSWAIYGDVLPALEALSSRGYALAVISNWDSHLPRLLEALDLARHFRVISVSAIEGFGKPDPEIFRRTCARLNVAAGEALHVGDSVHDDFEGARSAGLGALLLDRNDRHPGVAERILGLDELASRLSGILRANFA